MEGHRRRRGRRRRARCRSTERCATSDGTVKEPRYYQRTAINRSVEAILRGDKRLLLTLATGTGKTFVAMQIVWKLWNSGWRPGRNPRILYLADRNILDRPADRATSSSRRSARAPIWKLRGEAKTGREIYFALYQALADSGDDADGIFREFAPDFFDLVIVDECHRGSARAESSLARDPRALLARDPARHDGDAEAG